MNQTYPNTLNSPECFNYYCNSFMKKVKTKTKKTRGNNIKEIRSIFLSILLASFRFRFCWSSMATFDCFNVLSLFCHAFFIFLMSPINDGFLNLTTSVRAYSHNEAKIIMMQIIIQISIASMPGDLGAKESTLKLLI